MRFIFIILIIVLFVGCYSEKKATQQFGKAAITYPKIASDYCAFYYPPKDSTIKDTVLQTDTIYDVMPITDTLYNEKRDTITIVKTLPGRIITNTIRITDTVYRENTAKLKSCELDKSRVIGLLEKKTAEADSWHGKAKTRYYVMWSLILLLVGFGAYKIYSIFKPKVAV